MNLESSMSQRSPLVDRVLEDLLPSAKQPPQSLPRRHAPPRVSRR